MKRIEALVQIDKTLGIIEILEKQNLKGITIIKALGRGEGERPWIGGRKGEQVKFNAIDSVIVAVPDSKVDSVISAILQVASSGMKGDGGIFVSNIEKAVDIASKKVIDET